MEYNDQVRELLEAYHDNVENVVMPAMANEFLQFYSGVAELFGKLKGKGIIKDDPYFKSSEISEIVIPSTETFSDADSKWKTAERITQYEATLSFVAHNYNFSLNTVNFNEVEKIKKFIDYYDWKNLFKPDAKDINTRSFGKIVSIYKSSCADPLVIKTFEKCIELIIESVDKIIEKLKNVLLYLKESYKLFIRADILPIVQDKNPKAGETMLPDLISEEIRENYSYLKNYKKFIIEVVKEECYEDGANLKEQVIKKLTFNNHLDKKNVKKEPEFDSTVELIKILLELGKIRNQFNSAIDKLNFSHTMIVNKTGSSLSRFFRKLGKMLFNTQTKTIYSFTITSKNGGKIKKSINFEQFYDEIKKLEYDLLDFAEEDKIRFFLNKNNSGINKIIDKFLTHIKRVTSTMIGLDEHLKSELKTKGIKAKGIKPELTVLKSLINSVTAMYREYLDNTEGNNTPPVKS